MRLDQFLVDNNLVESRTLAQELIEQGYVYLKSDGKLLTKSSYKVEESQKMDVAIKDNPLQRYVSRGGLKLELAAERTNLKVKDLFILDIGQSTGGFTDFLLQKEAKLVVGVDVGQNQLVDKIKNHSKVIFFEKTNIKDLAQHSSFLKSIPESGFDLVVMDVSFISLLKGAPLVKPYLKKHGEFLFLVKPQFELGAKNLDKNGIVRHSELYEQLKIKITRQIEEDYGIILDYFQSGLLGKDGNKEFFIYGKKTK